MAEQWTDPPAGGSERDVLTNYLAALRAAVVHKVDGLTDAQAGRAGVPSGTSPTGLVRHLADVENFWFRHVFAAEPDIDFYGFGPDGAFGTDETTSLGEALERYAAAHTDADRVVAAAPSLDQRSVRAHHDVQPELRWVLVHVIDETARHAGHLDILRELVDGETGR